MLAPDRPTHDCSAPTTFERFGRAVHLRLANAEDLRRAVELDEAHWVATSAPVDNFRGNRTFLSLLDADGDQRVRASEVKDAIQWMLTKFSDTTGIDQGSDQLRLDAINDDLPDGQRIRRTAKRMLASLGEPDAGQIGLDQIRQIRRRVGASSVSEAGVLLPEAADDEATSQLLADILTTVGGTPYPAGRLGINQEKLDEFLDQVRAYLSWKKVGDEAPDSYDGHLLPLGEKTDAGFRLIEELSGPLDLYFAQCQALAFDPSMASRLTPAGLQKTDFQEPEAIAAMLASAPLATARVDGILSWQDKINPHYRDRLEALRSEVLAPLLGHVEALTHSQWTSIKQRLAAYGAWLAARPNPAIASLGEPKLQEYAKGVGADAVRELIARSHETALQLDLIRLTERLALFQVHLLEFANNFISFPQLYDPHCRALFERGRLVMDGRWFDLAVEVGDRASHAKMATQSAMFVMYVQVGDHQQESTLQVAVPVTSGGKGNLMVGKRGIFHDVEGRQCDALVVQILENPISLGEAMVAPFSRMEHLISGKIEKLTGAAEQKRDVATQAAVTTVQAPAAASSDAAQNRVLLAGGVLAGVGLAVAAISSALSYVGKVVSEHPAAVLGGLIGAVVAVLVPSLIVAFLKLRRRDLSAILEASGWAINARMRLSYRQTRAFTRCPPYPTRSRGVRSWRWLIGLVVMVGLLVALAYFRTDVERFVQERTSAIQAPPSSQEPQSPSE